jgi:integrase
MGVAAIAREAVTPQRRINLNDCRFAWRHLPAIERRCHILPKFGNVRLDALGKEAQQVFVTQLSRTVSRKTARNVMDTLSAILRKAKQWGYVCENVDFRALEFAEDAVKREPRFFTAKQVQQITEAAPEPYRTMFTILAMTGMRAGEMLGLQWEDFDFAAGCIHIRRSAWYGNIQTTKSKSSAAPVHLPESLAAMLRAYRERWKQEFLFVTRNNRPPSSSKVVQYGLWPVLDALKIPRCGLHAFRHYLDFQTMPSRKRIGSVERASVAISDR